MLHLLLMALLAVANPPEIKETADKVIHVTFPQGAEGICIYARRETKQEPDANFPDGYYTPADCAALEPADGNYDSDMWDFILPWFEMRHEPTSEWTVWAEITYPLTAGDLADAKTEIRKTPEYKVTR